MKEKSIKDHEKDQRYILSLNHLFILSLNYLHHPSVWRLFGSEGYQLYAVVPYQPRDLCSMGHWTTGGKYKATVGVLHFVLEENRHLKKKTKENIIQLRFFKHFPSVKICKKVHKGFQMNGVTLICMSWKKIRRVCLISWNSPLDRGVYV